MTVSVDEFLQRLTESGLMSADEMAAFRAGPPADQTPTDAPSLADQFVSSKRLTAYQAKTLLEGIPDPLVLGDYVVLELIGTGGMGQVYRAEHRRMGREVALKVLPPKIAQDFDAIRRFDREVRAAAKLSHPHIVAAYDAGEQDGTHYLITEFVDGDDLSATVKRHGRLQVEQAVHFILQAARGLEYAHSQGVIHRDIKPSNLLLAKVGSRESRVQSAGGDTGHSSRDFGYSVKILDMGLAQFEGVGEDADAATQAELTGTGQVMGTVDYMSPEQALDTKHADGRSDIYSLGCTLHYLLTGRPLFGGDTLTKRLLAHQNTAVPSLTEGHGEVPAELDAVFQKMVAKSVDDRYQSMTEVISALMECAAEQPTIDFGVGSAVAADAPTETRLPAGAAAPAATSIQTAATPRQSDETLVGQSQEATQPSIAGTTTIRRALKRRRWKLAAILAAVVCVPVIIFLEQPDPSPQENPPGEGGGFEPPGATAGLPGSAKPPPLAKAPFKADEANAHQKAWADYLGLPVEKNVDIGGGVKIAMVLIPAGEFLMGSTDEERARFQKAATAAKDRRAIEHIPSEGPQHRVRLTKPFYLAVHEVTQEQYQRVMGANPSYFSSLGDGKEKVADQATDRHPVEMVSWLDAVSFCNKLSKVEKRLPCYVISGNSVTPVPGNGYRLPTEAEWEYGCRAGTTGAFGFADESKLGNYAWYVENSGEKTHPVGEKLPNGFGVYDMHGNVWEWCWDWYAGKYYEQFNDGRDVLDPFGPPTGSLRVGRGGYWHGHAGYCRSAYRAYVFPGARNETLGFRLAMTIDPAKARAATASPASKLQRSISAADGSVNVMALLDLSEDNGETGSWKYEDGAVVNVERDNQLWWPLRFGSEADATFGYRIRCEFTRVGSPDRFQWMLPIGGRHTELEFRNLSSGSGKYHGGVDYLDGKTLAENESYVSTDPTIADKRQAIEIIVKSSPESVSVHATVDARKFVEVDGPPSRFQSPPWFKTDKPDRVMLRIRKGKVLLHSMSVEVLVGEAILTRPQRITKIERPGTGQDVNVPPLAVAPFKEPEAKTHQQAWAKYLGLPVEKEVELPGGEKMTFRLIPPGEFLMGSTEEEQARFLEKARAANDSSAIDSISSERPQHRVRISQPFYLGKHEVTQAQWQVVMGNNPSTRKDKPANPVEMVSWNDIQTFLTKLSEGASADEMKFALPTEAQWEYACRAGTTTAWHCGDSEVALQEYGWLRANSFGVTKPVAQWRANQFGLYDMHGNVWEWCDDWFSADYYATSTVNDPTGRRSAGSRRVLRGGSGSTWGGSAWHCRSAHRNSFAPDRRYNTLGCRLVMTIDTAKLRLGATAATARPVP